MSATAGVVRLGLVERDGELQELAHLLDLVCAGQGATVRVEGPAGVGKTTLLRSLSQLARERGLRVLSTSAGRLDQRTPYRLVRRLFDRAVMALPDTERQTLLAGPARLAMSLLLGVGPKRVDQGDLIASMYWLLEGLSSAGPLVLVADDAQWADEESLLFLGSLRERLFELPVLVVIAVREVSAAVSARDRGPALAALVADRDATAIRLPALSTSGVHQLLASTWHAEVADDVVDTARDVTGGNPFLLVALARLLRPEERTAERLRAAVPASVIDSVMERLAGLPSEDRMLAVAVAVLESASIDMAARLVTLEHADATSAVDRLRRTGLLADDEPLQFRHSLLANAVLSAAGRVTVDRLHRAAARLQPEIHASAAHLLATAGAADPWAVEVLRAAAQRSLADGAPQSAVGLLRRVVAEPPAPDVLPTVLLELGLAELRTADPVCLATLQKAAESVSDLGERARAGLALAEAYHYLGLHALASEVLHETASAVVGSDDELEVEAALVASDLLLPSRVSEARRRLAARPKLTGETRAERLFLQQQMINAAGTNQPAAAIRDLAGRAIHPDDTPETTDWVWARLFLAAIGEFDWVRTMTEAGFAQAAERGSTIGFVTVSFMAGLNECWGGSLDLAESHFRSMAERGAVLGSEGLVPMLSAGGLAQVLGRQGRAEEALEALGAFPDELPSHLPVNGVIGVLFGRAVASAAAMDFDSAWRAAERMGDIVREHDVDSPAWAPWRALAVDALRSLGRVERARSLAAEHLELCERVRAPYLVGQALRLVASVEPNPNATEVLLRRSVTLTASSGSRLQEAESRIALGAALRRAGQRRSGREQLHRGLNLAAGVGARGLVSLAESEIRAAGGTLTSSNPALGPLSGTLTASELRVALLAAEGLRNTEIARQLFVSPKTVETHLSRVYRKLEITGRDKLKQRINSA